MRYSQSYRRAAAAHSVINEADNDDDAKKNK
jgi:hypothetical protein